MTKNNGIRIAVVYGDVLPNEHPDEKDVLIEVECVCMVLARLGYEPIRLPFSFKVFKVLEKLKEIKPFLIFNLVESVVGKGMFVHFPLLVFDYLKAPYTGSGSGAMYCTTNKAMSKIILSAHGIPTPQWQTLNSVSTDSVTIEPPFIMKPVYEDASIGITDDSVFYDREVFMKKVSHINYGELKDYFIEQFIEGREVNVSLLVMENMPRVLPPAEITFKNYPVGKPKIVGYSAKWEEKSFEYSHTPRTFEFPSEDIPIIGQLEKLALRCWQVLGLQGYARVDFRIDRSGKPWVLEVNANPCISPDSGFIAAALKAGISSYDEVIQYIISDAIRNLHSNEYTRDYLSTECCTR